MRSSYSILGCLAIVLTLAGCDPTTERRYFTEGGGVDLYTADRAQQIELQRQYVTFVCDQAGSDACPGNWTLFVQAGMNDIDQRCDGFLIWLDARRRDKEPVLAEINALSTATHAIMTVTGASPKSLDIVVAAFGLASATYTNWNSRLLISVNQSTVQTVVYAAQTDFRQKINGYIVPDRPAAIYLLRSYLRTCMPTTIEAEINSTPVLVQRADQSDVKMNPLINPVRPAAIRSVKATFERVPPTGHAGEPTDPVVIASLRKALCMNETGALDADAHRRLDVYLKSIGQTSSGKFLHREMIFMNRLIRKNQTATCSLFA